jgi:hypothetical protein
VERPECLAPTAGRRLQTPRAAGVTGLAFAALFVTSIVLLRSHPAGGSTTSQIGDFYRRRDAGNVALVGVYRRVLHRVPRAGLPRLGGSRQRGDPPGGRSPWRTRDDGWSMSRRV